MNESPFVKIFEKVAAGITHSNLIVEKGINLFYQLSLNKNLELCVKDTKNPKRGDSAFQTDICISELKNNIKIPRIVIEFKTNITTHDILTYSTKAGKHKNIYPFLRYGLLASEINYIPNRFFIHNEHIDFFIAAQKYKADNKLHDFIRDLVAKEIEISKILDKINFENKKFDYYRTDIIFENFAEE